MKKNPNLIKLADNLRKIRSEKGLSQDNLALEAGVDRSYVGSIERAERNVGILVLVKLAKRLGCPVSDLLKGLK